MRKIISILGIVLLLLIAAIYSVQYNKQKIREETIEQMIHDKALDCYILEGAYPPNIEYLIKNYGLLINQNDFVIDYKLIGQNVPPVIKVVATGG